uniref:Uncharacterized protein n=1 Tax=Francisella tularensis subsp. novicida PA10-7858 TaxID=1386968 RepID=V5T8X1_FRANO|nr:hypothetical protein [Francisella tularensis]AHB60815.1 hypothetical protein N894_0047 [Francisella tularensis subsp. novicida PA10-7858]
MLIDFTILNEKKIINRPITNRLIKIDISSDEDIKNIVKNQFKYESKIQLYNFRNAYNSKNLEVDLHDNENNNTSQNTKKLYYIITKKNKEQIIGKATLKEIEDYIKLHKNEILSEYIHHEDK